MSNILRYHFIMPAKDFPTNREEPSSSVVIKRVTPTVEGIQERVGAIEYGWIGKDSLYSDEALEARLHEIGLYDLYDADLPEDHPPIGYAIETKPSHPMAFNAVAKGETIIELENVAFYRGHRGKGKGWQYFTKIMDGLFEKFDNVYWSQSSTNHATLKDYYIRKGMTYLGADSQKDFREPKVA